MQRDLTNIVNKNASDIYRTTVGVYQSHEEAINAIIALEKSGIPVEDISFLSTAVKVADDLHVRSMKNLKNAPAAIGAVLGPLLGILAGASIWAVPGLGFVYGAGAIVGALAGFDIGLVSGGIATILLNIGISKDKIVSYHKHLKEGKYLVILNSNKATAEKAKRIAHKVGNYIELVIM
ncbi:MAG: general stress protein [Bacteroidetes bacterium]|nr:general stress protein [Bacteroidota bacterium]